MTNIFSNFTATTSNFTLVATFAPTILSTTPLLSCHDVTHSYTNNNNSSITTTHDYYDCPCCDYFEPQFALLFPWIIEIVGILVQFLLIQFDSAVPYAAVMFLVGAGLGSFATWHSTGCCNAVVLSILQWTQIDSNVLLLTILPGLILRDAMELDFDVFMMASGQLLLLAYPMVLIGTVLTAVAVYYIMPWDWPWSLALTLGSILGSTDPIAVASVLKRLGAPPRLQLHLSGESTLNDGSAMVFFNVFSQMWFASLDGSDTVTVGQGFALFFQNALGGFCVGVAFAVGLLLILYQLQKRLEPEYDILQACAAVSFSYLSYYVADQLLSMSGVTASVTCAILAKAFGKGRMQDEQGMIHYLSLMEFLLNTLLFSLGGVVWGGLLVAKINDETVTFSATEEWAWLLIMYLLVMAIRCIQVACVYPILKRIGLLSNPPEAVFLSFAGMRGAVGIALALSLYRKATELDYKDGEDALISSIFFLSGGISLCTLLFNGTAAPWVLKWLGLIQPDDRKRAVQLFEVEAEEFVYRQCKKLLDLPRFHGASHESIRKHVPFVTEERSLDPEEDKSQQQHQQLSSAGPIRRGHRHNRTHSDAIDLEMLQQQMPRRIKQVSRLSEGGFLGGEGNNLTMKEELTTEMRHMFLDMVYHVYVRKLQEGEIDDDQNMQNNPAWMKQNLQTFFASNKKAGKHENQSQGPGTAKLVTATTDYWWNKMERIVKRVLSGNAKRSDFFDRETHSKNLEHVRETRPVIQRTLAFLGAHRVAERNFAIYMDHFLSSADTMPVDGDENQDEGNGGELTAAETDSIGSPEMSVRKQVEIQAMRSALKIVLDESKEQVQIARDKLFSLPLKDVRRTQSHTVVSILLKRLTKLVIAKVTDESLTPKEAQVYLDRITKEQEGLQECTGEEICHPETATSNSDCLDNRSIIEGYLEVDKSALNAPEDLNLRQRALSNR